MGLAMAQWIKVPAQSEPDNLSLSPRSAKGRRELTPTSCPLTAHGM